MKKRLLQVLITCLVMSSMIVTPVLATPQDKIDSLKEQKKEAEAEAANVNEELVGLLVEFDALKLDIKNQEKRIEEASEDLTKAEEKEKEQYEAMKLRIKYMYEEGDTSVVETLVSSKNFSDLVSKAEYVQEVHSYDREQLAKYVETKKEVEELKVSLESGKAEMESMADEMEIQKTNLEVTLTDMRSQIENFDEELEAAEAEAAAQLEALREQSEQMNQETSVTNNTGDTDTSNNANDDHSSNSSTGNNNANNDSNNNSSKPEEDKKEDEPTDKPVSNASLGQQIANMGCRYIGNKYVYGGNSLTNGIDCSGFVQQIHAKFGISTPRSSSAIRYGGKAVSYSNMLPGDVLCYSGHVAIYIGNNTVVHASNSKPYPAGGIKTTSPANYRTVLAVRRYW